MLSTLIVSRRPAAVLLAGLAALSLAACGGGSSSGTAGPPLVLTDKALYLDLNGDGVAAAGDLLILSFSAAVTVNGATPADLTLPVSGDSWGAAATLAAGPLSNQATVTLGNGARLRTRGLFQCSQTSANSPSGVEISPAAADNVIVDASSAEAALASTAVDLLAGLVRSSQTLGLGNASTRKVRLADMDGDGDLDLLSGNLAQPNRVWLNDGAGAYRQRPVAGRQRHLVPGAGRSRQGR